MPKRVNNHSDGKLLPGLNVRSSKEQSLPIIMSYEEKEQLIAVKPALSVKIKLKSCQTHFMIEILMTKYS